MNQCEKRGVRPNFGWPLWATSRLFLGINTPDVVYKIAQLEPLYFVRPVTSITGTDNRWK